MSQPAVLHLVIHGYDSYASEALAMENRCYYIGVHALAIAIYMERSNLFLLTLPTLDTDTWESWEYRIKEWTSSEQT